MLALLRQPLIKSVKIAQFAVKKFAQPNPRVLQRSCSSIFSVGVKKFAQPIPRVLQRSYGSDAEPEIKPLQTFIIFDPVEPKDLFIFMINLLEIIYKIVILYFLYQFMKLIRNEQNSTEKDDTSS
ncbi:hypothetical protein HCN44_006803 [Aphidius gifuensis]|uniref:Uncharacterized protein n=1 Tax=Aphidius gifuensis TaxID=684658 RepID=A0A834XZF5_APHGI|nr:uncharacterized protein LOC122849848 [Aphidius gifuensis]KAF7995696.1 hypothetical protein HCN44_006803 [Aphidius gifuensis]